MSAADSSGETVASKLSFSDLCRLLEKVDGVRNKKVANQTQVRKGHLKTFLDSWRRFHAQLHPDGTETEDSFYPAMRLLLPHLEKEREAYGIKEATLAKLYIEVLCIGKESSDAKRLLEYKAPKVARMGNAGDFAGVAYFVLKSRCPEKGSLSIKDVNDCLDAIAENNASGGNKELVRSSILKLLRNLSAVEQKWLIRMIMKELRCGMSQQTIFNMFHPDAEDLFNVTNSLKQVCTELRDPADRLDQISISMGKPFKPMLGDRGRPAKVEEYMNAGEYFIETKFDGERFQIHKDGDQYRYFSRGGNCYSDVYGRDAYSGTLTPYIHNCFLKECERVILDGEMMGYDPNTETMGTKAENFDIKSKDVFANVGYQPCFMIFDVLLYNKELLTERPLRERDTYVDRVVRPAKGRIQVSRRRTAKTKEECADALNEAIENRDEGIMIKHPESTYKPNVRKGGWYKIKPDYIGGLMDELDVLIVGGYFGSSASGMLSHFLCGVAVPGDDQDHPKVFHSFCKVGTGYTKKELFSLNRRLADHWRPFKKASPPPCLVLASTKTGVLQERPDVWIEPSKSAILQVKASELVYSSSFETRCTARFPRVEKIRDDKQWCECLTTTELEELRKKSQNKLTNRYELEEDTGAPKRRKVTSRAKPEVDARFKHVGAADVTKTSEIFAGKVLCILQGTTMMGKSEMEKKVLEFGGSIVQNPDANTTCIVANKKTGLKVTNFIKSGRYDVAKADWLARCISYQRYISWSPSDLWFARPGTEAQFDRFYDEYGDSFTEPTDAETLAKVFTTIREKGELKLLSNDSIGDVESEYFPDNSPLGLFRPYRFYIDSDPGSSAVTSPGLSVTSLEARLYGADISPELDDRVSHVIMDTSDLFRLADLRARNAKRSRRYHLVTSSWIGDCVRSGDVITERRYEP